MAQPETGPSTSSGRIPAGADLWAGRESGGFRLPASGLATATKMFDIKAWAEYVVEWAAEDPYGFLTTVILALTPLFLASAVLSWKLAKMIEAKEKEQKKKQKRQENIAKAKRLKKD
ncbi:small integral membrane protein 15 isoform X1 [Rhinolophus sinicus]|uniref:small integral membrane protein 15 isoform X1 n=1 Tax=Rhinolophus sinicus TaxID=89399 RepID=UPI000944C3F1|nr:PREDICTED: small integral membrane protein 15 isoform X1 [Rhinolophus sinicus]